MWERLAKPWRIYGLTVNLRISSSLLRGETFASVSKQKVSETPVNYLTIMTPAQRWAL